MPRDTFHRALPVASLSERLSVFSQVVAPTVAKGPIIRRRRVVGLVEALGLDARAVRAYLTKGAGTDVPCGGAADAWRSADGRLEVLWYPALDHAQVFDTAQARRPMVDVLTRFVEGAAM